MKQWILAAAVVFGAAAFACGAQPVIFFSDIVSGPSAGGKRNGGAFVTIVGRNFGTERGQGYVTVGGGRAADYPVWTDTRISIQLGPEAKNGGISVTTAEGSSNSVPFTVREGRIFFVDDTSPRSPGSGTFDDPWRSPASFYQLMQAGDLCYFREGTYAGKYGEQNSHSNFNFGSNAPHGSQFNEIAFVGYPGELVRLEANTDDVFNNIAFGHPKNYYVIAGFYLYAKADCVSITGNGNRIVNNRCEGNKIHAYAIIHPSGDNNSKVYGNELFGAASGSKMDHPLYVGWGTDNLDFGWNHVHDNDVAEGPLISVNTDNATVEHYKFENIRIHDNILDCRRSSVPLRAIGIVATDAGSSVHIYNNIIIGSGPNTIYQYSASSFIYNNTLYRSKGKDTFYLATVVDGANYYRPEFVDIRNNVIYNEAGCNYITVSNESSMGKVAMDHNCYYGNGDGPARDSHAVNADPLMIEPEADNFRLTNASPCVGGGDDLSRAVPRDIYGRPRSGSLGFDIGACARAPEEQTELLSNKPAGAISGYVTDVKGKGLKEIKVVLSGETDRTATTDLNGFYQFKGLKADAVYTVSPESRNIAFTPARRRVSPGVAGDARIDFRQRSADTARAPVEAVRVVGASAGRGIVDPTKGDTAKIYFNGRENGTYHVRIFTMTGTLVWEATVNDAREGMVEWDPGNAASGIYIVTVSGPGFNERKKVAVLK